MVLLILGTSFTDCVKSGNTSQHRHKSMNTSSSELSMRIDTQRTMKSVRLSSKDDEVIDSGRSVFIAPSLAPPSPAGTIRTHHAGYRGSRAMSRYSTHHRHHESAPMCKTDIELQQLLFAIARDVMVDYITVIYRDRVRKATQRCLNARNKSINDAPSLIAGHHYTEMVRAIVLDEAKHAIRRAALEIVKQRRADAAREDGAGDGPTEASWTASPVVQNDDDDDSALEAFIKPIVYTQATDAVADALLLSLVRGVVEKSIQQRLAASDSPTPTLQEEGMPMSPEIESDDTVIAPVESFSNLPRTPAILGGKKVKKRRFGLFGRKK
ncbi:hypothetical protein J8273_6083 [Carpediemonas membranifera]|uniref:Uncharacterized protein n=1 Tax=Carpediemonas membranifera TaxID=201153 RepID=A0A8J6AU86_9EUKA|nr:hypothetical protein J8273_6083 [Carpediemonas membranifera]|eukprot:KAG9392615.1 hypothetical protein J8273_6083 [Carpediemonas membranifera]